MDGHRHRRLINAADRVRCALGFGFLVLGLSSGAAQAPDRPPHAAPAAERGHFIVAFELHADRRDEFVWPHPTFPPAGYARVLLVADAMPYLRAGGRADQSRALAASQHLRINGRLREPRSATGVAPQAGREGGPAEFLVELDAGRLRLVLVLPHGAAIDPRHESAHITLYEAESSSPDGIPARVAVPTPR